MNILEEFWYGNIEPAEYDTSSSKEYKEIHSVGIEERKCRQQAFLQRHISPCIRFCVHEKHDM